VQLHRDRAKFEEAGVRVVVVGQGRPEQAARFRDSHNLDLEMLVDARRQAYKAAGTKVATFNELLGPRVVAKGMRRALASGVRQGRTVGHPAQLGGVLLVMPDGSIPYSHLSDDASDNPANEEVLEAVHRAIPGG
jgi:prostamide/prostaglandin F2alpha synthase